MSDVEQYQGEDFAAYIARERERLNQASVELRQDRQLIDERLSDLDRELAAIDAYEKAKTGKPVPTRNGAAPRARRGSRRETILNTLQAAPLGMTRGELLQHLGVKGDKAAEMSVSNALTALQRQGQVTRRENGHWVLTASEPMQRAAE